MGEDGETHQGVYDISYLMNMYGMCVMAPATQQELKEMLKLALKLNMPTAIRYNRGSLPQKPVKNRIEYGKWEEIIAISDVTIIAEGRLVETALKVPRPLPRAL